MRHMKVADGTRIAWRLSGMRDGGPLAVLCDGISCDGFIWRDLLPGLEARGRVLHVHYRGHGRSGLPRDLSHTSVAHLAADIAEIMRRKSLGPAVFLGHSMGVQVIHELGLRHRDLMLGAVLMCGSSGRVLDTLMRTDLWARLMPTIRAMTLSYRGALSATLRAVLPTQLTYALAIAGEVKGDLVSRSDLMPYLEHFARMPMDVFVRLLEDAGARTVEHQLGRLDYPCLVLAGADDSMVPTVLSRHLADALPRAMLRVIPGASHTGPIERPKAFFAAIESYFRTQRWWPADDDPASATGLVPREATLNLADQLAEFGPGRGLGSWLIDRRGRAAAQRGSGPHA